MPTPVSHLLPTPRLPLHLLEAGSGEPLVLIHGWPQTAHCWHRLIPRLATRWRVIAPDLRGFGLSGKEGLPLSRAQLAADIAGLLDTLGLESAHIVGHDWGGMVALKLAFDCPDRVRSLTLVDCSTTHWPHWAAHGLWAKVPGWAEAFFAQAHDPFIHWCFNGEAASYPPGIISPFPAQAMPGAGWCAAASLAHYRQHLADPAVQAASVSLYRDALPFFRPGHDGQWQAMTAADCQAIWQHPGGPFRHPDYQQAVCFAPEDLAKTVQCPALYVYTPMLLPRGFAQGQPVAGYRPGGDPFADSIVRPFARLQCAGIACGHFVPEERPEQLGDLLEDFLLSA